MGIEGTLLMANITLFYIFFSALMTSVLLTPSLSHLAIHVGGIDTPDERKVHCNEIPRLGGIAVFCAFLFSVLFFTDIDRQIKAFLVGAVVIFLTGLADDITGLRPRNKLIGEILAATMAIVSGGISLSTLGNPLGIGEILLGPFAIPFTIFAVVGVMNAINLIDGLDGLAGGTSAVACLAFGMLAWKTGNYSLSLLLVALLGAIIGFLRYNTYPASIFMGDAGSLFLGYCMGFFPVMLLNASRGAVSPVAPLMILGVPILDTLVVMYGRKLHGKSISSPDKTHIHHRLLKLGLGHRFSVLFIYGLSYLLATCALLLHGVRDSIQLSVLVVFCIVLYAALRGLAKLESTHLFLSLKKDKSLRNTEACRTIVSYSHALLVVVKYLLLLILSLVIFVKPDYPQNIAWGAGLLVLCMSLVWMSDSGWGNSLLKSVIYCSGLISIFIIENYGRQSTLAGLDLLWISHGLFALLLVTVGINIVLRNLAGELITSPFEYLVLFVVVAVPLLPSDFTARYHLMSVAAKSVIMFVAYMLILMRQARHNRKILVATFISLLILVMRQAIGL
ncbi:undecaprenyl/decaprenyl-phosphate alpha-N-acetylglucosaminyl 1-phosphate transferase [Oryzomonas rubra]|uniref:Undecaprenyl/decaprenyl-phosphate alpha-N-acetylglucosaminyl 1-phosphate transferase n=2 Tax=Oryzomonas rubra TaxID=2509454 RepID=A0A5A9XF50_9BACT|nr:undecaprenyl/decaprenyl-phosphate alpha-N-acetylglucosaminyl 1-phosphate transferase [Oryzomonas rubra]